MKKDKFILVFLIIQVLTFVINSYISFTIGTALQLFLLFYELFFIVTQYKSKNRKFIVLYMILLMILLGVDTILFKEAGFLLKIYNMIITPIFVFSYYSEKGMCKYRVLETFKVAAILLTVFNFLLDRYSIGFPLLFLYPFIFIDRKFSYKNAIIAILVSIALLKSSDFTMTYVVLGVNTFLAVYNIITNNKKKLLLSLFLIGASIISIVSPAHLVIYGFNSDVFFNERLAIKLIKTVLALIPFGVYSILVLKRLINNKFKINYEMYILIMSLLVFAFVVVYARFDYEVLIILFASYSLIVLYEYFDVFNTKLDDKKITILIPNLLFNDESNNVLGLSKMFKNNKFEVISTYKSSKDLSIDNVNYLIDRDSSKQELESALSNKKVFKIIKLSIRRVNELICEKAFNIEKVQSLNSKYLITGNYKYNEYGSYASNDIVKIAIEHGRSKDEDYINKVSCSASNYNYLVVTTDELKNKYSKNINKKVKCLFIPNIIVNSTKKKANNKSHNIVSIGDLIENNHYEELISAIKIVSKDYEDVNLTIVGTGKEKKDLTEQIKDSKLSKNIHLVGNLKEDVLEEVLLNSSLYISVNEGLSSDINDIIADNYSIRIVTVDKLDKTKIAKDITDSFESKSNKKEKSNIKDYLLDNVEPLWKNIIK